MRGVLTFSTLRSRPVATRAPRGDGHGVLVLPGLLADDLSTGTLRRSWPASATPHAVGLGRNVGPTDAVLDACPAPWSSWSR